MTWWQGIVALLGAGGGITGLFALLRTRTQTQGDMVTSLHETMAGMVREMTAAALQREETFEARLKTYREEMRQDVAEQRASAEKWRDRYDECDRDRIELRARVESLEREMAALIGEPPPRPRPREVKSK